MTDGKSMVKGNKKVCDGDLLDLFSGLKCIYASYIQGKGERRVRDLLLLNEIYNAILEIERIQRIGKTKL